MLLAESDMIMLAGNDVHDPIVAITVYVPSWFTSAVYVFPVGVIEPPFNVHTVVKPVAGVTDAVMVVVLPGNSLVYGDAVSVTEGWALTVSVALAVLTILQGATPVTTAR